MENTVIISGNGPIYVDWTDTEKAEEYRQSWFGSPIVRVPFSIGQVSKEGIAARIQRETGYKVVIR